MSYLGPKMPMSIKILLFNYLLSKFKHSQICQNFGLQKIWQPTKQALDAQL